MIGLKRVVALLATSISLCGVVSSYSPLLARTAGDAAVTGTPRSIDFANIDKNCIPCKDFYEYANGVWLKNTPIPDQYDKWGVLNIIDDKNVHLLRTLLEKAEADKAPAGSNEKKLGDFYYSGMNTQKIDSEGTAPLSEEFKRIDEIKDAADLQTEVARLQSMGVNALFGFGSGQDFQDSTKVIAQAGQGGLGLPEREYYLKDDEASKKLRDQYVAHMSRMFVLLGKDQAAAAKSAQKVMDIETKMAKYSMPNIDMRDPEKVYHKMTIAQFNELTPRISWTKYLSDLNQKNVGDVNVGQPEFFKGLSADIAAVPLDDWKDYLRWHLISETAPYLSQNFVDENFAFFGKTLTGKKEILPRWKRVVNITSREMGEALGQLYVKTAFTPEAKEKALGLVSKLREVLREDLAQLDWMDEQTRKNAVAKLDAFGQKIGYPDAWRDYSGLKIDRDSYVGNVMRSEQFEFKRQLDKIGKPVDRKEWLMTPQTVNAYYCAEMNEIVFPAGILQPPIFDPKADDATNLGAMGMVIGHEMTHGFDDQGSKFDGQGNLKDWWSPADKKRFQERVALIEKQYDGYKVAGDVPLKGKLVAGEAAADLGGVLIAYKALQKILGDKISVAGPDGFTPEQKFFLSFAQAWATNIRPEKERLMAATDPHPVPHYRVNGTLANINAFEKAFHKQDQCTMMLPPADRCHLW